MIKLDEYEKTLVDEISTISEYTEHNVRNVLEFSFYRQMEQLLAGEEISLPFIGKIKLAYEGDITLSNEREAVVTAQFHPSSLMKRIMGDIADGEADTLLYLLEKKFKKSLQDKLKD